MDKELSPESYREILKILRKRCREKGYVIHTRSYRSEDPEDFGYGYIDLQTKKLKIFYNLDGKIAGRLLVLFHEYRHFMHITEGLYSNYYTSINEFNKKLPKYPRKYKLPNLAIATRAERNCDLFAEKALQAMGYQVELQTPYQKVQTAAYKIHVRYIRKIGYEAYCQMSGSCPSTFKHIGEE